MKSIAYKTLVRPLLEYGSTIWDPHFDTDIKKLEQVQNRAARFTVRDYSRESSITAILGNLNWESLRDRRTKSRLTSVYKETHGLTPNNIKEYLNSCTGTTTRSSSSQHTYKQIRAHKDCYRFSLYPKTLPEWNLLPQDIRTAPDLKSFKAALDSINIHQATEKAHYNN